MGFYKNKEDMYKRLKESSMLLHTSEREGLGIIVLQSILLGTPVLLPDYSPIPKEVRSMCIVAKPAELDGMAAKMLEGPKSRYINKNNDLSRFYISKVNDLYMNVLKDVNHPHNKLCGFPSD